MTIMDKEKCERLISSYYTREDVLAGFVGSQECANLVSRFGI